MKMRTLGRQHRALLVLGDGKEHYHKEFSPMIQFSSKFLELLLIRGLVERSSLDLTKRATYKLTPLGKKALQQLEATQQFDDLRLEWSEVYHKDITICRTLEFIAKRGFKWVEVTIEINEYWKEHFAKNTW